MRVLHININYLTTVLHQNMICILEKKGVENTVFAPTYDSKIAIIKTDKNVIVSDCYKKWDKKNRLILLCLILSMLTHFFPMVISHINCIKDTVFRM